MRNLFHVLLFCAISAAILTSCKKDKDDSKPRDAFIGSWSVNENFTPSDGGDNGTDNYIILITASATDQDGIKISNFANIVGLAVEATISGSTMTIPSQDLNVSGTDYSVSGSGTLNGSVLNFNYNIPQYWSAECTATEY